MLNQSVADQHKKLHARVRNTLTKAQGQGVPLTIPGYFFFRNSQDIHSQLLSSPPSPSALSLARNLRDNSTVQDLPEDYKKLLSKGTKESLIKQLIEYYTHSAILQQHINQLDFNL